MKWGRPGNDAKTSVYYHTHYLPMCLFCIHDLLCDDHINTIKYMCRCSKLFLEFYHVTIPFMNCELASFQGLPRPPSFRSLTVSHWRYWKERSPRNKGYVTLAALSSTQLAHNGRIQFVSQSRQHCAGQ